MAHAGEEGPPAYVWSALDVLKVERIDHGVQSVKDPALVQRLAMDERNLFVIPDSMSYEDAALCEPLSVGIWACRRARLQPGDDVLVSGAGPVGVLAAQAARALGAGRVTVTDVSEYRLGIARSLGLETELGGDPIAGPGHERFDVLLECSGAPGVLASGLWRLREDGRAAMVGMPKNDDELPLSRLNLKEISVALVNRYAHTWPTAIELIAGGRVDVRRIVSHRFGLDGTADALLLASRVPDSLKAIVHPQRRGGELSGD